MTLDACRRAMSGMISHLRTNLVCRLQSGTGVACGYAFTLCLGLLLIPWPSSVRCDCRVASVAQRNTVAPFDGPRETVSAKHRVDRARVKTRESQPEVASRDRVRIEVAVPANEVAAVVGGQSVTLWLDGMGGESISGSIECLLPDSEVSDGDSVYIADLEFENSAGKYRPGMRGRAQIETPLRPLGWVLFHPLWERTFLPMGITR